MIIRSKTILVTFFMLASTSCFALERTDDYMSIVKRQAGMEKPQSAEVVGDFAERTKVMMHAKGPIIIDTKREQELGPGCGSVKVRFTIKNTPKTTGEVVDFWEDFRIKICKDGNRPSDIYLQKDQKKTN